MSFDFTNDSTSTEQTPPSSPSARIVMMAVATVLGVCASVGVARHFFQRTTEAPLTMPTVLATGVLHSQVDGDSASAIGRDTSSDTASSSQTLQTAGHGATHPAECRSADSLRVDASTLNLNSATAAQLDALPGVGPVLAGRIVAWRAAHHGFTDIHELQEVSGIGPSKFSKLRSLVRAK
jgi:competence ComEA-like helix-hairpin-helix protein